MSEIIGIGTDVIEIDRVISYCEKNSFFNKYYTEAEREKIVPPLILPERKL